MNAFVLAYWNANELFGSLDIVTACLWVDNVYHIEIYVTAYSHILYISNVEFTSYKIYDTIIIKN
jgi:hypothetical protein